MLSGIDQDSIPTTLANTYQVIQPRDVEIADTTSTPQPNSAPQISQSQPTNYLTGENLSVLWGITSIGADQYQYLLGSEPKIKVGVLDTGIDADHSDLTGNVDETDGYDFVNGDTNTADDNGHGTHVSGIIAAKVNGHGVFGVNSNAELVPFKVLNADGMGSSYDVIEAIETAAQEGVKVLNVSLGGVGDPSTDPICQAITDAKNAGTTTVIAAGNSNVNVSGIIPAGCSDALTVGAIDQSGNKASFSNYGNSVTVSAP